MSLSSCSYAVGFLGLNSDRCIYCYYCLLLLIESLLYTRGRYFRYAYIDILSNILFLIKIMVGIIISILQVEKLKLRKINNFPKVS